MSRSKNSAFNLMMTFKRRIESTVVFQFCLAGVGAGAGAAAVTAAAAPLYNRIFDGKNGVKPIQ